MNIKEAEYIIVDPTIPNLVFICFYSYTKAIFRASLISLS